MNERELPLPPRSLAVRVGAITPDGDDEGNGEPGAQAASWELPYRREGRDVADTVRASLPADWGFAGRRVLDFGCGAGRVLRHFAAEAQVAEFMACDIDERSIVWVAENLVPPFAPFVCGPRPPLPLDDASVDLIYAASVYTHLTDSWSAWMVEHHRVLAPGGYLWATFIGPDFARELGVQLGDDGIVFAYEDQPWDCGGPIVAHTRWWIEEHWGRAFEIAALLPDGLAQRPGGNQGFALLRRREVAVSEAVLVR